MASSFEVGDLVWAKMKGFPPWPGLVSEPPDNKKINEKKPKFYIFFFGSENYAWVTFDNIWSYLEKRQEYLAMLRPTHSFQEAVDATDDYVREHGGYIPESPKKSPAKLSDNEEEKLGSGRRSRKRPSTMPVVETPTKSKPDIKPKSAKKDSEKKKERRDSSEDKKEPKVKRKDLEELKTKKLNGDDDDDEDDGVELKSKRISRKRNDEDEDEEEGVEGGHDDDVAEKSPESTKEKSKELEKAEEGGDDEDEEVEKMLVDEETVKKLNESKESEVSEGARKDEAGVKGDEKEEPKVEKEVRTNKREVRANGKVDSKEVEKPKKLSTTPQHKAKAKEEASVKKKENGVVAAKRKSTAAISAAAVDKKSDSASKKTFLPDVLPSSTTKKLSSIVPTTKKIGFIGCGSVGSRLVENLLASRHQVLLWNRTAHKCKNLLTKGASKCSSPSDVTKKSDVIITCLSDAAAFKDVVYGSNGVLQAMKEGKGLVNLTTVDVETTLDACEAVTSRGGLFLEAAMLGSIDSAAKGDLLVLVSGDQTLYEECSSVFKAISKNIFNLVDIGTATKMQVVFNSLYGTTISGLAEGLSLASKVGLDPEEVLEVVGHTSVISPLIRLKGEAMAKNSLSDVGIKLDTLQRSIRLAINMSEEVDQPLHVCSVVNELFKKAKAKGYGDCDVAAVFRATDL